MPGFGSFNGRFSGALAPAGYCMGKARRPLAPRQGSAPEQPGRRERQRTPGRGPDQDVIDMKDVCGSCELSISV